MLIAKERELQALEMRKRGMSYQAIGDALGITMQGASLCVKRALERLRVETDEKAEDVRDLELERLDKLMHIAQTAADQGELGAIDRILRIQERRSKYLGLDAPAKTETHATVAASVDMSGLDDRQLSQLERAYAQIMADHADPDAE
jgi:hypothetical protein